MSKAMPAPVYAWHAVQVNMYAWQAVQVNMYAWHAVQVTYCRNSKTLCTQNKPLFVCVLQACLALVALCT